MIFCTVVCANHLAKAYTMIKSLKTHMPNAKVTVCLVEHEKEVYLENYSYIFDETLVSEELNLPNFPQFMFRHSIYEASCAMKAQLFHYMLDKYPHQSKFIYLDSDIKVYGPFNEVDSALDDYPIIITPHHLEPLSDDEGIRKIEEHQLRVGTYNMGFLAVKRSSESKKFLKWWADRLYRSCYIDPARGLFLDQKWMDLAPAMYDVMILKSPGYNVAGWNIGKRRLHYGGNLKKKQVNGMPLRFIHFSGIGSWFEEYMKKYVPEETNLIHLLHKEYINDLKEAGDQEMIKVPWSFDYFCSGERIKPESRLVYRNSMETHHHINPFTLGNNFFGQG